MASDTHSRYMTQALRLAEGQLGLTMPNPAVGCVIVREGNIVGLGATARGGRPHAEIEALAMANEKTKGATLYVTLEPCTHHGNTPPCAEAVIDAGIQRVVIACTDPDPRVSGSSIALLQKAGIDVITSVMEQEARELNRGFFSRIIHTCPLVTMKLATSLDGKMATADGESQWITGEKARQYGHYLRRTHDAILTGIGTVLADDPALTCRLQGCENDSPTAIVLDRELRILPDCQLMRQAAHRPLWVITGQQMESSDKAAAIAESGARLFYVEEEDTGLHLQQVLTLLAEEGVTRLLIEAGPALSGAMLKAGLVHELYWFRGPLIIGGDGKSAMPSLPQTSLSDIPRRRLIERISLGEDVCDLYRIRPCLPA